MKNRYAQLAKIVILLVLSLGLLWFSEGFSPVTVFEPHTCLICLANHGRCQGSTGWVLWMSYAKDLIQPFALYFLLCLGERWLKTWQRRALLAFAIPAMIELGQGLYQRISASYHLGYYLGYLGAFDPLDILMYAIGVGLAVIVERLLFAKLLKFW